MDAETNEGQTKAASVIDFGDVVGGMGKVNTFLTSVQSNEWVQQHRQRVKSWPEFFRTKKFALPRSPKVATKRFIRNISYFRVNYIFVSIILLVYCIITSPLLLLAFALLGYGAYLIRNRSAQQPFMFRGRQVTVRAQYVLLGIAAVPIGWLAGLSEAIFWIIGASVLVVVLHTITYKTDEEIEDDQLIEFPTMQTV